MNTTLIRAIFLNSLLFFHPTHAQSLDDPLPCSSIPHSLAPVCGAIVSLFACVSAGCLLDKFIDEDESSIPFTMVGILLGGSYSLSVLHQASQNITLQYVEKRIEVLSKTNIMMQFIKKCYHPERFDWTYEDWQKHWCTPDGKHEIVHFAHHTLRKLLSADLLAKLEYGIEELEEYNNLQPLYDLFDTSKLCSEFLELNKILHELITNHINNSPHTKSMQKTIRRLYHLTFAFDDALDFYPSQPVTTLFEHKGTIQPGGS